MKILIYTLISLKYIQGSEKISVNSFYIPECIFCTDVNKMLEEAEKKIKLYDFSDSNSKINENSEDEFAGGSNDFYSESESKADVVNLEGNNLNKVVSLDSNFNVRSINDAKKLQISFKYTNCSTENCKILKIYEYPTITVTKNSIEHFRIEGTNELNNLTNRLIKLIKTTNHRKSPKLHTLTKIDHLVGIWIILIDYENNLSRLNEINDLIGQFPWEINFAKISTKHSKQIIKDYNINNNIYKNKNSGIENSSILSYFYGAVNFLHPPQTLQEFATELITPAFINITCNEFYKTVKSNVPTFVVFYIEMGPYRHFLEKLARHYSKDIKFYKSNDISFFKKAKIFPETHSYKNGHYSIVFTVYKQLIFHKFPFRINQIEKLQNWIFSAHFPHLIHLDETNIFNVFSSLKPVLLLFTHNEFLVKEFDHFSGVHHSGIPFTNYLFAVIDSSKFKNNFLNPSKPTLAIFNPQNKNFYHEDMQLDKINFEKNANLMILKFETGKLKKYGIKSSRKVVTFWIFVFIVVVCFLIRMYIFRKVGIEDVKVEDGN